MRELFGRTEGQTRGHTGILITVRSADRVEPLSFVNKNMTMNYDKLVRGYLGVLFTSTQVTNLIKSIFALLHTGNT